MKEQLIGHQQERKLLREYIATERSEFIAVYGRRRVGKTFLIRQVLGNDICFSLTGMENATTSQQLANFNTQLMQVSPDSQTSATWLDAFHNLTLYLEHHRADKKIVFLDELSWLETQKSGFLNALEYFWNSWASARTDIKLIVCGSAAAWMLDNVINNYGGLHNRVTHQMLIEPFHLMECKEYFDVYGFGYGEQEIAECYMAFGGIPYYLSLMRTDESVSQNIDRLLFSPTGELRNEKRNILRSLFRKAEDYEAIIDTLSEKTKGLTRTEILQQTKLNNNARFTKMLEELEMCGFIRHYESYDKLRRQVTYQLIDPFVHFAYKVVSQNQFHDEHFWTHSMASPLFNSWSGLAFEMLCLNHIPQLKHALGISGMQTNIYTWHTPRNAERGAQIDLVIDRADPCVNICEMKFSRGEYEITKQERERLEYRIEAFMQYAEKRKSLRLTMITTNGIKRNTNSYIVQNEITLHQLFEPITI